MNKHILFFIFLFSVIETVTGQSLHQDIQATYNFEPHKLSDEQQKEKAKLLDGFWKKVTDNKESYLPELRKELQDKLNPTFFLYDGGHLMLTLTESKEDYQIALNAMVRCNLKDIDGADFVRTMNFFAYHGLNTTEAGIKIISQDTFWAYIPQHALMLHKYSSLLFILLPINSDLYLGKVIDELMLNKDTATIKSVLQFLDYTCTCKADSIILKYSTDKNQVANIQNFAALIVKNNSKITQSNSPKRYKALAGQRKEILRRVSDEALDELDEVTNKMKGNYACR